MRVEWNQSPLSIQPAIISPANQEQWIYGGKDQSQPPIQSAIPPANQGYWTDQRVDIPQKIKDCKVCSHFLINENK